MTNQEFLDKMTRKQKRDDDLFKFFILLVTTLLIVIPLDFVLPFNSFEAGSFNMGMGMLIQIIGAKW